VAAGAAGKRCEAGGLPGLMTRKLRWWRQGAARKRYEAGGLQGFGELQLAAEEVQASKSAVRTAGEQRYPSSDGGHRPAMAACMARLNVAEALTESEV
jgi:hypothetical protein